MSKKRPANPWEDSPAPPQGHRSPFDRGSPGGFASDATVKGTPPRMPPTPQSQFGVSGRGGPASAPGVGSAPAFGSGPGVGPAPAFGPGPGVGSAPAFGSGPGVGSAPAFGSGPGVGSAPAFGPGPGVGSAPAFGPGPSIGSAPGVAPKTAGFATTSAPTTILIGTFVGAFAGLALALLGEGLIAFILGWVCSSIIALGFVFFYSQVDLKRQANPFYLYQSYPRVLYGASVLVALIAITACAAQIALYVGRA